MRQAHFAPIRHRVAGAARGRILEIGIGSGLNLASYGTAAETVYGVDPSPELLTKAVRRVDAAGFPVRLVEASSEELPFEDQSFDCVVTTFTLCTIPEVGAALREMRRVLKRDGELQFAEHGRASDAAVVRWQDRLTPLWKRLGGGCHLNRPISELIHDAGFRFERIDARYLDLGPRPFSFIYEGCARPA